MTSNVGARNITKGISLGFGNRDAALSGDKLREMVTGELKNLFRPEFLNRLDEVIVFDPLTRDQIVEIVDIMITNTRQQLALHGLELRLTDPARQFLADQGFEESSGARPLRRAIQRNIDDVLSEEILSGKWTNGDVIEAHLVEKTDDKAAHLAFEKVEGAKSDLSAFDLSDELSIDTGASTSASRSRKPVAAGGAAS
jgi:ATP-dependent Clp protease ATP-binding subunit ClpC